ncbi:MAG TPA: enolase C-terminal domain-like protein, partial [Acidimicrobiales bacterium]|nr:enolase C-terminal domain-like protein [Acidimicrobiales bacterium]
MPEIDELGVRVYTVPTEEPESDGTLTWTATTVVVAEPSAEGVTGLGFSYATGACARLINDVLADVVIGQDVTDVSGVWSAMVRSIRNLGRPGIASMAIAAVDTALWDLKAKLLQQPLVKVLGQVHDHVAVYGSGGFTSLTDHELTDQLGGWVHGLGVPRVKIKVGEAWGSRPGRDVERAALAREVIGDGPELFVDANGAYSRKQAIRLARSYADLGVSWFEEPVSSDHLGALAEVRAQTPIDVTAGEYGYDLFYFKAMCQAAAVDCLQADVSRCAGVTGWLRVAALAESFGLQISGHCAQSLHVHPSCAVGNIRHLEYFADHARLDRLLFDGVIDPTGGVLAPDLSRP